MSARSGVGVHSFAGSLENVGCTDPTVNLKEASEEGVRMVQKGDHTTQLVYTSLLTEAVRVFTAAARLTWRTR